MHSASISHSLAQRAPPATRTRVRWQPYNSVSTTLLLPSPTSTALNTPSTSATSSPTSSFSLELNRPRLSSSHVTPHYTKDISHRDLSKNKIALGLVDQAVKSLSEIWKSQDIPSVFQTGPKATKPSANTSVGQKSRMKLSNPQLPSPISPTSQPSPSNVSSKEVETPVSQKNCLLPIKGFIHEVLKRSRTSCHVLQTALCYIEALRPKVPEFIRQDKAGERWNERASIDAIEIATNIELQQHADVHMSLDDLINSDQCESNGCHLTTVQMKNEEQACKPAAHGAVASKSRNTETLPLAVELPSPLLCPRRSFLAALILASKFTQDKCYSNRAWAKLSGLTPREISRCERALGDALQWRLWVGKLPVVSQASAQRPLHRAQSESCLNPMPSEPFTVQQESLLAPMTHRPLRRCSTLPADAFTLEQKIESTTPPHGQINTLDATYCLSSQWPAVSGRVGATDDSPDSQSSTPPLAYSPTSSDSSSGGDRTIQVSSFQDIPDEPQMFSQPSREDAKANIRLEGFAYATPSDILQATIEEGIQTTWRMEGAFIS